MSTEDEQAIARQVADLNKYGQALNRCETVDDVVSLTLEAVTLLFELSDAMVVEVREGAPRVLGSTNAALSEGDSPSGVVERAVETGETVSAGGDEAAGGDGSNGSTALAVPAGIVDEINTVIVVWSPDRGPFGEAYVRPLEILASHAATAISNIRSRERLERARQDLETRKEMIEMYDRLLRHDIGNDLQVMGGFADALANRLEDEQSTEYAEKIRRAAYNSADMIDRVGDLVSTLEEGNQRDVRELAAVLAEAVPDVEMQYESLTVEFDREAFEYRVYAGDLLDSVFANVVSNAAVHNEGDITVRMYAEEDGADSVVVGMADDGTGVPADVREDIFEMGVKGSGSEGTGLGLGFVRALTESYGGGLELRDGERGGADFRVRLERA